MIDLIKTIKEISEEHPARVMPFDELAEGLAHEVSLGYVNVVYHPEYPELAIYKYSVETVQERKWNKFTLIARGLILDHKNKVVVATPFPKFFNYGEIIDALSVVETDYVVTEKMDGSLGILFKYDNKWMVATAGSFMSEQAQWAKKWLVSHVNLNVVDGTNTYLFEIIYGDNKIVVDYDFEGLVLLGIYDKFGLEYPYDRLQEEAKYIGVKITPMYTFEGMSSILEFAKKSNHNFEGFVIRFKSGVRLKIKTDEYVRIHRLISRVTPLAIWEALVNDDNLDEIVKELPEEIEKDFWKIVNILKGKLQLLLKEIEMVHRQTRNMSDKELGLFLQQSPNSFRDGDFPSAVDYIFAFRKGNFFERVNDSKLPFRRKIFNNFKPKANKLDGYVPSNVVNRFSDDV